MKTVERNGQNICVVDYAHKISNAQDALDLMATAQYQAGSRALVIYQESLGEDFFDLKTRFAGEVLQKFSNYHMQLAIVGNFSAYKSNALQDFIRECNNGKQVFWVNTLDEALDALAPCRK